MDFALTDDQRAIQDAARAFAEAELAPHSAHWDEEKIFPVETMKAAAEMGPRDKPEDDGRVVRKRAHPIVGMTNELSACSSSLSGQRAVTVLTLVQNFTPSMPCWLVSPKAERFQPPKV